MSARERVHAMFNGDEADERELDARLDAVTAEALRLFLSYLESSAGDAAAEKLLEDAPALAARLAGEKATAPAVPTPRLTGRIKQLLDAVRTAPGVWTTGKAFDVYRLLPVHAGLPLGMVRNLARGDLRLLAEAGHLTVTETTGRREYRLNTRKDVRR